MTKADDEPQERWTYVGPFSERVRGVFFVPNPDTEPIPKAGVLDRLKERFGLGSEPETEELEQDGGETPGLSCE